MTRTKPTPAHMKTLLGLLLTSALLTLFEDTTAVTAQVVTNMGVADAVKNFVDAAEDDGEGTSSNCVGRDVMVIAAHPDDEVVCCSGVISRAVKHGMCVQVVVLTNGEYFGSTAKRGIERQRELLEGLKKLGLNDPNSAIFLGYPDNALKTLYIDYNNKNTFFTTNKMISETYGAYGRGRGDYHFVKTGKHAKYNYPSLFEDVKSVISEYDPTYIFISASSFDTHGDHLYTYKTVQDALEELPLNNLRAVYSTTVRNGYNNWPNHIDPFTKIKPITLPEDFDQKPLSLNVPLSMRTTNWTENKKYQAMREHKTQGGDECSFILRFLHRDEMFFVAGVSDADPVPVANAGEDQIVCEDTTVYLDGSGTTTTSSSAAATTTTTTTNSNNDNIKDTLAFSWTQSAGPAVDLKDAGTARPHFVFKANTPIQTPVDLEFELTVKDPRSNIESFPNSVVVTVVPRGHRKYGNNIAPDATVMASSQTAYTGQVARAAVDGVVDGLLRVSPTEFGSKTNEWVAEGERGSAWIKLEWDEQVNVAKVVLYDRVSCKNHVLGGVLSFSDGSTVDVGELNNIGGPTVVEFEPKNVIGMMFTINAVSNTTVEDGLAEIMVYGLDEENYGVYCSVKNNVNDVNNNNFNNVANENEADEEADEEEDEKDEMGKQETEEEKDMKIQLKMEKEREELMEEFGEATAEAPEVQERDDNKVHVKDANAPQTRFAHEGVEARKENKVININGKEKDEEEEEEEEDEDVQMEKNKDKSDKNIEKTEKVNKEKVSEDEEKEVIITDGGKIDTKRYPVNTNYVKRQSTKAALASMNKRKARIMFLNGVFVFFALVVFIVTTVKFNLANKATMCFTHRAF